MKKYLVPLATIAAVFSLSAASCDPVQHISPGLQVQAPATPAPLVPAEVTTEAAPLPACPLPRQIPFRNRQTGVVTCILASPTVYTPPCSENGPTPRFPECTTPRNP